MVIFHSYVKLPEGIPHRNFPFATLRNPQVPPCRQRLVEHDTDEPLDEDAPLLPTFGDGTRRG